MSTKKKYPEFELPELIVKAIKDYLGPAQMAKLTAHQRGEIAIEANTAGRALGRILENPDGAPLNKLSSTPAV